jgi:hypothetical protein
MPGAVIWVDARLVATGEASAATWRLSKMVYPKRSATRRVDLLSDGGFEGGISMSGFS